MRPRSPLAPRRGIALPAVHPMKNLLRLLSFVVLGLLSARAADEKILTAVRAADAERMAATKAADPARLAAIFSDELRYAHSSGKVDTKASYSQSLTSKATVYESFDYKQRDFLVAGPGVVLMSGRCIIRVITPGQPAVDNDLNFLAVWREENGKWRFLSWQSCKNPAPAAAAAPATK
jgi:hypothetical protein